MKALTYISVGLVLYLSGVKSQYISDEGVYFRRLEAPTGVPETTPTATPGEHAVPVGSPVPQPTIPQANPPPVVSVPPPAYANYPPPVAVTYRAQLYNLPIPLAPGETLTYEPNDQFIVRGVPPPITGPIVNVLNGRAPEASLTPDEKNVVEDIGPALAKIPAPSTKQTLLNLLTPDVKSDPVISNAAKALGLQTTPPAPSSPPPSPPSGSSAKGTMQTLVGTLAIVFSIYFFFL